MADIELVIKIPEEKYLYAKSIIEKDNEKNPVIIAIGNGIPISKEQCKTGIYLVEEYYNNGWDYEDEDHYTRPICAFPTEEEATQFIAEIKPPIVENSDEQYIEVREGDDLFKYSRDFGDQCIRYFILKVWHDTYETLAYSISLVPFGKAR